MRISGSDVFIKKLNEAGELRVIKEAVSSNLEITEITDRISKKQDGGEALLFENTNTEFPVLTNALGSENRMQIVLGGRSAREISDDILEFFKIVTGPSTGLMSQLSKIPKLKKIASWMPRKKKGTGLCQEIVMNFPDLYKLPILNCWPADGGPFITLPLVHTVDPETGIRNVGMYRLQVFEKDMTGMHWHMHKTGARHYREYKKRGQRMPVAVALGGDPVYTYSATAPLPDGIDEYMLAGFLRKKPVELVKCLTQNIWVPADADFILEGYVDPSEDLGYEGPFGDHTGFYSLADYYPKFHITAITHRKNAIYPATIVGIPPMEDAWIAKATEEIFREPIKLTMIPELKGFHLPEPGVAHNIGLFSIECSYPGQGMKTLNTVWGAGQMMFTKFGLVFDENVDLLDYADLARKVSERVNPKTNILRTTGPLDILDHASDKFAVGGKLGLDATGKPNGVKVPQISDIEQDIQVLRSSNPGISQIDTEFLNMEISLIVVSLNKTEKSQVKYLASEITNSDSLSKIKFVIFTDADLKDLSWYELAWLVGANVDTERDCTIVRETLIIDATRKRSDLDGFERDWPNPVVMDDKTIQLVNKKWKSYRLGNLIQSPSSRYKVLMNGYDAISKE